MAARNLALILPFTPGILKDLSALLPIIFEAAQLPTESLTVVFSTPGSETQLYAELRKAPKAHFEELQVFLGKVYAALAAGQWTANRVLLEVEVRFDGELGDWSEKLQAVPDEVVRLEGFENLGAHIVSAGAPDAAQRIISSRKLPEDAKFEASSPVGGYPVSAIGGTFDHLHAAHKILINMALFVSEKRLIVGVMSPDQLKSKSNAEELEDLETRLKGVNAFLKRCGPGDVKLDVVEIHDALGPTAWDPEIEALVVSRETLSGGAYVNKIRKEKGLGELEILCIGVISSIVAEEAGTTVNLSEANGEQLKELKMGSTAIRGWIVDQRKQRELEKRFQEH